MEEQKKDAEKKKGFWQEFFDNLDRKMKDKPGGGCCCCGGGDKGKDKKDSCCG